MDSSKDDFTDKDTVDLGVHQRVEEESSRVMAKSLLSTDQIFGPYRISRQIAKGAMGIVYLAEDLRLGREVALKIILTMQGLHPSNEQVDRFVREARSIAKVRHHAIVPVYEAGEIEGLHYFTMEFIRGPTLEKFIVDNDINAMQGVEIIKKIAEGLQAAHEKGIVHRDIKPANILMENGDHPMITDFGLAKFSNQEQKLTMTGSMLGTPCYMSPEQARGDSDVDFQSDLFSLGIILYEIVCHKLPFKGDTYMKTVLKVIEGEYVAPKKISPRLSRDVENIIRKSLEKDRAYRYKNAGELISDCDRFLRGEVVLISSSRIWRKWIRTLYNNASKIVLVSVFSVLVLFLYYKSKDLEKQNDLQRQAATQAQSKIFMEKEEIRKKLDKAGEILKSGTTSPEFIERFVDPAHLPLKWDTIGATPIVDGGRLTFLKNQATTIFPNLDTYPNSSLFEMSVDLGVDAKVRVLVGYFVGESGSALDNPVLIEFSKMVEKEKTISKSYFQVKVWTLKGEIKRADTNNLESMINARPIATRRYPAGSSRLKTIRIKKFETAIEVYLSDDTAEEKPFRLSSLNFFKLDRMVWGVSVPASNEQAVVLEGVRVDKYFPGTEETEINSILDSASSKETMALRRRLLKYAETMQQAHDFAVSEAEKDSLKYKSLRATFLASIVLHRYHFLKIEPKELKSLYEGYEMVLNELTALYQEDQFEEEIYDETRLYLLRFSLFQLALLDYYNGENDKAVAKLQQYQKITNTRDISEEILWFLPTTMEAVLQRNHGWQLKKNNNYLEGIIQIFSLFKLQMPNAEKTYTVDFVQSIMDIVLNTADLATMIKLHEITKDNTNLANLEKLFLEAITKLNNEEMAFQLLQKIQESFGLTPLDFLSNSQFMNWRYGDQKITTNKNIDAIKGNLIGSIDGLGMVLNNAVSGDFSGLNNWMKKDSNLDEFLFILQDLLMKSLHENTYGQAYKLGDIFPVDVKVGSGKSGKINLELTDKGLVVKLQTWNDFLENRASEDCWQFYFDFGPGLFFMHNRANKGRLRIDYAPKARGRFELNAYSDNKPIKIEVVEHYFDHRLSSKDEVVLLIPMSEIRRLAQNRVTILYFGFNGMLRLNDIENTYLKKVHEGSYALYKFDNSNLDQILPEFKNNSLKDRISSFEFRDVISKRVLVKNIFEDLLGLTLSQSLMEMSRVESAVAKYQEKMKLDVRKMSQGKVISSLKLMEELKSEGIPFNLDSAYSQYSQLINQSMTFVTQQKKDTKEYSDAFNQLIETAFTFREELNWGLVKKSVVNQLQNAYLNVIEKAYSLDAELFKHIREFYDFVPDSSEYAREKAYIAFFLKNYQSTLEHLKKANESEAFDLDSWLEYQYAVHFLGYFGHSTSYDLALNKKLFEHVKNNYSRVDVDLILTLMGEMRLNEFLAKYPRSSDWLVLLKAMRNEVSFEFDREQTLKNYLSIVNKIPNSFIKNLIQLRIDDMQDE